MDSSNKTTTAPFNDGPTTSASDTSTITIPLQKEEEPKESTTNNTNDRRCCCNLPVACKEIRLEPVLFLQNIVSQMVFITSQDLMIEKTCLVNHNLGENVCSNLTSYDKTDEMIHDQVSEYMMWRTIFESSIKVVWVLFVGPWSDRWGRRLPLILCLMFLMGESALMLLNAHMTSWKLEMMLICSVSYALSGGIYGLLMLSFSHASDKSSRARRTFRIGCLDTFWYLGTAVGYVIKPLIKQASGYTGVFTAAMALCCCSALYVFFRLRHDKSPRNQGRQGRQTEGCQCSLSLVAEGVGTVVKPRPNGRRLHIILLIVTMMLNSFAVQGESNVKYLFALRAVDWTSAQYGNWAALASFLSVIGAFVVVPLVTLRYVVPDAIIGVIGVASRLGANLAFATVNTPGDQWLMYLGAVLGSFSILAPVAIRSLLSKLAAGDVGSVFSVMAAGESVIPFISGPLYKLIYTSTNTAQPGVFNYLSAIIHAIMMANFGFLMWSMKRHDG